MLDILDKYESLIRLVQNSDEYDKDFLDDLLNFLYKREQVREGNETQSLDWWIDSINDKDE